jgi:hypothetical protein
MEADTSISATVATLRDWVIHDGRARATARPTTTRLRRVACTSCCATDRSVSDSTRMRKKNGTTQARYSQPGSSSVTGRPNQLSSTLVRAPSQLDRSQATARPAPTAAPSRRSTAGESRARSSLDMTMDCLGGS